MSSKKIKHKKHEEGSSLVEVLLALFVLLVLMIGILQMFSAAFVINQKSSLKTLEAYKCQQVAENLRMVRRIMATTAGVPPGGIVFADNTIGSLPYDSGDDNWDYWGPGGANIIEMENAPYRLYYRITQTVGATTWTITTTAVESSKVHEGQNPYEGQSNLRRVEYVTQIAN